MIGLFFFLRILFRDSRRFTVENYRIINIGSRLRKFLETFLHCYLCRKPRLSCKRGITLLLRRRYGVITVVYIKWSLVQYVYFRVYLRVSPVVNVPSQQYLNSVLTL